MLICLLAGAMLNIAVAMTCTIAAQQFPGSTTGSAASPSTRTLEIHNRVQGLMHWTQMERPGYREFTFLTQSDDHSENAIMVEVEAGWPWRSLRRVDRTEKSNVEWMRLWISYHRQSRVASADAEGFLIPTTPIWSGFIYNSLLYAAVLWVVFVAAPATRRQVRLRRGLCPRCAYPIGASDRCSECGVSVPRSAASRPQIAPPV